MMARGPKQKKRPATQRSDHGVQRLLVAIAVSMLLHITVALLMRPAHRPVADFAVDFEVVEVEPGPPPKGDTPPPPKPPEPEPEPPEPEVETPPKPAPAPKEATAAPAPEVAAVDEPPPDPGVPDGRDAGTGSGICLHNLFDFSRPDPAWLLYVSVASFRGTAYQQELGHTFSSFDIGRRLEEMTGLKPAEDIEALMVSAGNIFDWRTFQIAASHDRGEGQLERELKKRQAANGLVWEKTDQGLVAAVPGQFRFHLVGSGRVLAITYAPPKSARVPVSPESQKAPTSATEGETSSPIPPNVDNKDAKPLNETPESTAPEAPVAPEEPVASAQPSAPEDPAASAQPSAPEDPAAPEKPTAPKGPAASEESAAPPKSVTSGDPKTLEDQTAPDPKAETEHAAGEAQPQKSDFPEWPKQITCITQPSENGANKTEQKANITPNAAETAPEDLLDQASEMMSPDAEGHWPVAVIVTRDPRAVGLGSRLGERLGFQNAVVRGYFTEPVRIEGTLIFNGDPKRIAALANQWRAEAERLSRDPFLALAGVSHLLKNIEVVSRETTITFALKMREKEVLSTLLFLQLQGKALEQQLQSD